MQEFRKYADRRPYVLPPSLDALAGPTRGTVELPASLGWTGRRHYDLAEPADTRTLYERVIVEVSGIDDLTRLLNADRLRELWLDLYIPQHARRMWEAHFPELTGHRNRFAS
ncbi:MAG: hypothetical protein ACR2FQ_13260 [Pseudonocardiaceae bacterium]